MDDIDNFPIAGERCRLRGKMQTGLVSFVDLTAGWARVEWDDEYKDTPEVWQQAALDTEETDADMETVIAEANAAQELREHQQNEHPPVFPTGIRRVVLRAIRGLKRARSFNS